MEIAYYTYHLTVLFN